MEPDLFIIIDKIYKTMRENTKQTIKEIGLDKLNITEINTLLYINDSAKSMKDLVNFLTAANSTPTRIIDSLVADGLVERFEDPEDRRKVMVRLTPRGQELCHRISSVYEKQTEKALSSIEPDDRKKFFQTIFYIEDNLMKH